MFTEHELIALNKSGNDCRHIKIKSLLYARFKDKQMHVHVHIAGGLIPGAKKTTLFKIQQYINNRFFKELQDKTVINYYGHLPGF